MASLPVFRCLLFLTVRWFIDTYQFLKILSRTTTVRGRFRDFRFDNSVQSFRLTRNIVASHNITRHRCNRSCVRLPAEACRCVILILNLVVDEKCAFRRAVVFRATRTNRFSDCYSCPGLDLYGRSVIIKRFFIRHISSRPVLSTRIILLKSS